MTKATETILHVALAHYGPAAINVDADCITLSDGTKIFFRSLYLELSLADPQDWSVITADWLAALDAVRAAIASSG